jgi:uncharacterized protein (DUF1810 family)
MDPYRLQRFVDAQAVNFDAALAELRRGRKTSHWMWYVFPQIAGLGSSALARRYALGGVDEARAYLAHPVLGERLRLCVDTVLALGSASAESIFGHPDCLKFRSCLTLFARAAPDESRFADALARFFAGRPDPLTLRALGE